MLAYAVLGIICKIQKTILIANNGLRHCAQKGTRPIKPYAFCFFIILQPCFGFIHYAAIINIIF